MLEPRMSNDIVEALVDTPDEEVANEGTHPPEPVL